MSYPRIIDDDRAEIRAELESREVRSWEYHSEAERRQKILMAREYAEGWFQCQETMTDWTVTPHRHVAGTTIGQHIDKCAKCGTDLRCEVHAGQ